MADDRFGKGSPRLPDDYFQVPASARIWNYWLGGKDNYQVDREAGDAYLAIYPAIRTVARQSRQFLIRSVRYLAGEAGVRQFLDIGTGLPAMQNTHEVAQAVAPGSRIVYVDNDRRLSGSVHGVRGPRVRGGRVRSGVRSSEAS